MDVSFGPEVLRKSWRICAWNSGSALAWITERSTMPVLPVLTLAKADGTGAAGATEDGGGGSRIAAGLTAAGAGAMTGASGRRRGLTMSIVVLPPGVAAATRRAALVMALLTASKSCAGVVLAFIRH